jgi:4-alpha-glucanotransferase
MACDKARVLTPVRDRNIMPNRTAGVVVPLFSLRTRDDWGIGEILDLPKCAAWVRRAGHRLLQILPPYELAAGETSPYGARTAFGLDPIYISIGAVEDLDRGATEEALGADGRRDLDEARRTIGVNYAAARKAKARALHAAFERFHAREWTKGTARAAELARWIERERDWAEDLALYVALRDEHGSWGWEQWPGEERNKVPSVMLRARERLATPILEHHYLQWIAHQQWMRARAEMGKLGVELMGDLPFIVGHESADVWSRAWQFRRDVSLGAPPDGFAPEGQDWGLPAYDWERMREDDLKWIRARTRHAARLYDRFRLDHVVGYFRMFVKRKGERGFFDPEGEAAQQKHGEAVMRVMIEEAKRGNGHVAQVIAEDLGVIPPFVRETLKELGVPGYKVIPWEKDEEPGKPEAATFRDPARFAPTSVATWSTHDTAPVTAWWDDFTSSEKDQLDKMAGLAKTASADDRVYALLGMLFRSGSALTLTLIQELLGERTRINTPGVVGPQNWSYRLPRPIEDLEADPQVNARFERVRALVTQADRG